MQRKKFTIVFSFLIVSLILFSTRSSYSCTTVFSNNNSQANVVARTVDLYMDDQPTLVVYPRGVARDGETGTHTLKWKSKYGSVAVAEFHSNAVSDGMNESGLAVHLLYLSNTKYPTATPGKPQIANYLWAQYILDNYTTVKDALAGIHDLQIVSAVVKGKTWPLHLTMEDASGDSAIIEYIDGKVKVYHGEQYRVMTNEPAYSKQMENLKRYVPFGGKLPLPGDPDPMSRFVRASAFLKTLPLATSNLTALAGIFAVIRTVAVPFGAVDHSGNQTEDAWATRWISVADLSNKVFYFNSTSTPNIVWLDLTKLNFDEKQKVRSVDPTNLSLIGNLDSALSVKTD